MIRAVTHLHGERNAPELPIPSSAIASYAKRFGLSGSFIGLVQNYDTTLMASMRGDRKELVTPNGKAATKT